MRRTIAALTVGAFAAVFFVSGCGHLKRDEFLPEYKAYKTENADRFSSVEASVEDTNMRIDDLESSVMEEIQETNEDTLAAVEQGDADTLAGANQTASEGDIALQDELSAAIAAAAAEVSAEAAAGDEATSADIMATMEGARSAVMSDIEANAAKSSMDVGALRDEIAAHLATAIAQDVGTVHFASGSSKLSDEASASLDEAVATIKASPNAVVTVIGHADSRPILSGRFLTNLQLSEARAQAVARHLVAQGVENEINVSGRGHFETVGSQGSADGRQGSRRVDVTILAQ